MIKKLFAKNNFLLLISSLLVTGFVLYSCNQLEVPINTPRDFTYGQDTIRVNHGVNVYSNTPTLNNGGGVVRFSISNAPSGITINQSTGIVHCDSTVATGTYNITIAAYNPVAQVSTTLVFVVGGGAPVASAPSGLVYTPSQYSDTIHTTGNSATPNINNGGAPVIYSISTSSTAISIDSTSGVISWDGTLSLGIDTFVVTATNTYGSTTATVILTINNIGAPSNFSYTPSQTTLIVGTAGSSAMPTTNTGAGNVVYSITGSTNGISVNSTTGVISWSSTVPTGTYHLTITATNNIGSATANYTLVVNNIAVVAPSSFSYTPNNSNVAFGNAGTSVTPTINNGQGVITYTLAGGTSGISINATTGVISWTNTLPTGAYNLTATATNSAGSTTATYTLYINNAGSGTLNNLVYNPATSSVYHGVAGASAVPTISNTGGSVTYSISGNPSGVMINASTGVITWSNAVDYGTYTLTITANNGTGTTSASYSLIIKLNPDDYLTPRYTVAPVQTVYYASPNNNFHNVDVYMPANDPHTKRPAFMFLHGGGFQSSGTKTESYVVTFCTYMAQCGYVAFAPNYNEGSGHTLPQNLAAVKDADACLAWMRNSTTAATYSYDPTYLFVGGGSAGAHLVCNLCFADGSANYGGYNVNLTNVIAFADCWGSSPDRDRLYNYSSLNANSIPTFIVHGSADQTVAVSESITLANYLNTAHSLVDFWQISGETHGCPNHRPAISDTMSHFFNRVWKARR